VNALEIGAALAASAYFAFLLGEAVLLRRARRRLRAVVHVNGTRGKTETTRLIAAALRAGGVRTLAKTTGTEPRAILEDGSERFWRRLGAPNVREQRAFLLLAARRRAEVAVAECMAVSPDAQAASTAFLAPSVLVVTNTRPDHQTALGTPDEALEVFASGISRGGLVVTADAAIFPRLEEAAASKGARALLAAPLEIAGARSPENAGAALAVAEWLGVPREAAVQGMLAHVPDPGAFALRRIPRPDGGTVVVVDALAANDPVSTELLFERAGGALGEGGRRILLLANRADRPDRSLAFAAWAASRSQRWEALLLAGEPAPGAHRILARAFAGRAADGRPRMRRLSRLCDLAGEPDGTVVFAAGNWKVLGPALAHSTMRLDPLPLPPHPDPLPASGEREEERQRSIHPPLPQGEGRGEGRVP
jgi:gamma-polyglutamate synthase